MTLPTLHPIQVTAIQKPIKERVKPFEIRYIRKLNLITVGGWSITKDIHKKYAQLLIDLDQHLSVNDSLDLRFRYELFDSSSLKYLFVVINTLNKACNQGKKITIHWSCMSSHKQEMIETGLDLAKMCDFKFEISYS